MRKRALAAAILAGMATQASAFQIDTGNDDLEVRWDNTLKYNAMVRVKSQDGHVANQPGYLSSSDYSFDKGELVSNRFDLLTELDVVWKNKIGFRISGAAWYDHAYENDMNQADDVPINDWGTAYTTRPGELTDLGEKYHHQGGELLDAFAFLNWEIGDVAGNLRAGRHVIYWGQSLLGTGAQHGAGGSMNPLDFSKALSVPGSEAKELFMPTNKISTLVQLTDNLSVAAYYSLQWQNIRLPVGNSYFSPSTGFTEDFETFFLQPGVFFEMHNDEHPDEGEWGINFSYYFEDLGMEVSAFYLNYHDKAQNGLTGALNATGAYALGGGVGAATGIAVLNGDPANAAATAAAIAAANSAAQAAAAAVLGAGGSAAAAQSAALGTFAGANGHLRTLADGSAAIKFGDSKWAYKEDIDLFGLSFSKQIGDVSYGMDIIHRRDVPIRHDLPDVIARSLVELGASGGTNTFTYADFIASDEGNYPQNTGDSWHVIVNALGLLTDNGIWEGGSYIVEATFSMIDDIDYSRQPEYLGLVSTDNANDGSINVDEGRVTSHLAVVFRPTWYQVMPGVDLTGLFSASVGIDGNGTYSFMGDEESGSATLGVEFSVDQKWTASLRYNNYFGSVKNSFGNYLKDRDNVSLTFKRTF